MFKTVSMSFLLGTMLVAGVTTPAAAKRSKKAKKEKIPVEMAQTVRSVLDGLKDNSDPLVRSAVFKAFIELGGDDEKAAIERGFKEKDWAIRGVALKAALTGKDKKLKKAATASMMKLLESAVAADRTEGLELLKAVEKDKTQVKRLKTVAKKGSIQARAAARAELIKRGGKEAWKIIEQGLKEAPTEPEHKQALEALKTYREGYGIKWAMKRINQEDEQGELARTMLLGLVKSKHHNTIVKALRKAYAGAASNDDFDERVRLAWLLAEFGKIDLVKGTLLAGFTPDYVASKAIKSRVRRRAWTGLRFYRDPSVFGHTVSRRRKLKMFTLFLKGAADAVSVEDAAAEMKVAFDWLRGWAKETNDPKVIKMMQLCTKSDRAYIRTAAMDALANIGHRPSKDIFFKAIGEGRKDIRLSGARGLAAVAKAGDEEFIGKLLRRKEPHTPVRLALIEGLANIGTPAIIGPLQLVLMARDNEIKIGAAKAIAKVGGPQAATLLSILKNDPNLQVRFTIWKNLLLQQPNEATKEFKSGALTWINEAQIRELGKEPLVPIEIFSFLAEKGSDSQRKPAVVILKERGAKAATRLLTVYETAQTEDTASQALEALAHIRGARSVATYRKALKNRFGRVRAVGFSAIRQYGPKALLETVQEGMKDKDPLSRVEAARAAMTLVQKKD